MRYLSTLLVASFALMFLTSCSFVAVQSYPTLTTSQTRVSGSHDYVSTVPIASASESERVYNVQKATEATEGPPLEPGEATKVQVPGKDPYTSIPSSTLTRPETAKPSTPLVSPFGLPSQDTSRFTVPSAPPTPSTPSTPAITFSTEGFSGATGPSLPGAP